MQPLSNLMATGQIHRGDCIRVTHSEGSPCLTFSLEGEFLERGKQPAELLRSMARMISNCG